MSQGKHREPCLGAQQEDTLQCGRPDRAVQQGQGVQRQRPEEQPGPCPVVQGGWVIGSNISVIKATHFASGGEENLWAEADLHGPDQGQVWGDHYQESLCKGWWTRTPGRMRKKAVVWPKIIFLTVLLTSIFRFSLAKACVCETFHCTVEYWIIVEACTGVYLIPTGDSCKRPVEGKEQMETTQVDCWAIFILLFLQEITGADPIFNHAENQRM